jgi:repressor of nif and glnA expression
LDTATRKRTIAILRALDKAGRPLGATQLVRELEVIGVDVSQRTVRYYLTAMDSDGLTRRCGKRGREITSLGSEELANAFVAEKVGFVSAKVDELSCQMTFDPRRCRGTIILNVSTVPADQLGDALREVKATFEAGLGMGRYAVVGHPGQTLGRLRVPDGRFAIGTVCSVTINGILLSAGIPAASRFGGLLELDDGRPVRFTEMIRYDGSSLDPLEIFISGHMTRVREAVQTGRGIIGAGMREIPAVAVSKVRKLCEKLEAIGLGGVIAVGKPNRPLLEVPVPEGRAGLVVAGGLNPLAAAREAGVNTHNKALTGLFEFEQLVEFGQLDSLVSTPPAPRGT